MKRWVAALALSSAGIAFVPLAQAGTTTLPASAEGWYQPNPSCTTPAGCVTSGLLPAAPPAQPPTSPFTARTLHIGLSGGQETARSYLAYPLSSLEQTVTGGILSVPLDVSSGSGSMAPETAKIQVCVTSGTVADVDGSISEPPKADCAVSVPVTYVATPQPHLEAGLGPLAAALASATGLALLPDATKAAQTDSWRVVFSARNRTDAAKTSPASLSLELADPVVDPGFPAPEPVPTTPPTFGAVAPPVGTGFAPQPPVDQPVFEPAPPAVAPAGAAPITPAPAFVTVGYAYPIVWMLPLVFLVLGPLVGRALTKDLMPVPAEVSGQLSGDSGS